MLIEGIILFNIPYDFPDEFRQIPLKIIARVQKTKPR